MNIIFTAHNCNLSFIENEIRYLLNHSGIENLKVYTDFPIEDAEIAVHDKIEVFLTGKVTSPMLRLNIFPLIIKEFMSHAFWYVRNNKWKEFTSILRNHLRKANFIYENGIEQKDILYSFWGGSGAFVLSALKQYGISNLALTRLHAFDIYEDGDNKDHIPWRNFIYSRLNKLITISKHGESYLKKKYSFAESKINTINLGIYLSDFQTSLAPVDGIHVVSCSWVGKRKNLSGVCCALGMEKNMSWTHLGDGEDFDSLKEFCLSEQKNLKVKLPGRLTQEEIHNYYEGQAISCFISLSTNEGLPVSMMEAMAHGIPVVSADVGGCSEIVNENTGVLLPKNYTEEDVRKAVYLCSAKFSSREARQKIQDFIKENFDAEKNYEKFVDFLEQANNEHHEKLKND